MSPARWLALLTALATPCTGCGAWVLPVAAQDVSVGQPPPIVPLVHGRRMQVTVERATIASSGIDLTLRLWPADASWGRQAHAQRRSGTAPSSWMRLRCEHDRPGSWVEVPATFDHAGDYLLSASLGTLCPGRYAVGLPVELELRLPAVCRDRSCEGLQMKLDADAFNRRRSAWPEPGPGQAIPSS